MASRMSGTRPKKDAGATTSSAGEEWRIRQNAFKAARLKAKVDETREALLMRDEFTIYRVYPDKQFIATGFLMERSEAMREYDLFYKFSISEDDEEDNEVTLQIWKKINQTPGWLVGEVGDLYRLDLEAPGGGNVTVHVVVESRQARDDNDLMPQYSVFDIGHKERAFTIKSEAWWNWLTYRDMAIGSRREMDARLLFHALGSREMMGYIHFLQFKVTDARRIQELMSEMVPGKIYTRPTVEEAMLATDKVQKNAVKPGTPGAAAQPSSSTETLRMGRQRRKPLGRLAADFHHAARRRTFRIPSLSSSDEVPSSSIPTSASAPSSPAKKRLKSGHHDLPPAAQKIILDCLDPYSDDNIRSREIFQSCQFLLRDEEWRLRPRPSPSSPQATLKSWSGSWASTLGSPRAELSDVSRESTNWRPWGRPKMTWAREWRCS